MLELRDIQKRYRQGSCDVHALRGVSLNIADGDYVAIMGPSGSGKSTLLHLLGLLDVPDEGSYRIDGREIAKLGEDELAILRRDTCGFVFQQFHLLARLAATQNVALPLVYSRREPGISFAEGLLERVGLAERAGHRPSELSGGQQQRVAIARALVNRPRYLLADEPTGDLDSANEDEILALFDELNAEGITIIVVTHEEEVARRARRVIRMRDGLVQSDVRQAPLPSGPFPPPEPPAPPRATTLTALALEAREYLEQGVATLSGNKVRTALSTLGILMGVAAVVAMLGLGRGAQRAVEKQIASMGSNLLVLRTGAMRVGSVSQEAGTIARLTMEDVSSLKERVGLVREAAPVVEGKIQATFFNRNWQTRIVGTSPSYERIRAARPRIGRFFSEDELRLRSRVAILGATVKDKLFGNARPVGERIRLNRVSFQVIGVLPRKGTAAARDQDDVILIPVTTAMRRVLGVDYIDSADIEVSEPRRMEDARRRILNVMTWRHRIGVTHFQAPFEVQNMAEVKEALSESSRNFSILLGSIAVISLLVGGIGIMNIMLVSITERTREIGVRKALGARRADILAQFLAESVIISLFGGLAGVLLGIFGTFFLSSVSGWAVSISPGAVALSFFFSVSVGILFGIYPAHKASLLQPIEALRHE